MDPFSKKNFKSNQWYKIPPNQAKPTIKTFHFNDAIKLCVILLVIVSGFAHIIYRYQNSSYRFNMKALQALEDKDFNLAEKNFKKALVKRPFDPWFYVNLVFVSILTRQDLQAVTLYDIITLKLKKNPIEVILWSQFNQAIVFGNMGYFRAALNKYQKALKTNRPLKYINHSFFTKWDKNIKTNIEFLMKEQDSKNKQNQKISQNQQQPSETECENETSSTQDSNKSAVSTKEDKTSPPLEAQESKDHTAQKQESSSSLDKSPAGESKPSSPIYKGSKDDVLLKEAEKQENQARRRFYRQNPGLKNKPNKDW